MIDDDWDFGYSLISDQPICHIQGHYWDPNDVGGYICIDCRTTKGPQPYLMGTPEETFLKNVYHFGLLKALHRYFESKCVKYVTETWILSKNMRNNPHNFVFYHPPLWRFTLYCRIESLLRRKVYPKKW